MADRIHVEITGSSKDLQREALAAVSSIKGVSAEVKRSDTQARASAVQNRKLASSINDVNRQAALLRNTIAAVKWPAMIAGAGMAAQAVSTLAAGAVALTASLAPLSGAMVALPAGMAAAAQASATFKLAAGDLEKALKGDEKALKSLTPEARKFAGTLKGLKPELKELRSAAGRGLFEGLDSGLQAAVKNFDVLKVIVRDTGGAMGEVAKAAGTLLGSKAFGQDLAAVGKTNATTIERMGRAGVNLGSALRHVLVAAGPFIDWMSRGTLGLSRFIDRQAQAARESGRLAGFFNETKKTMQLLWPILRDGAGALMDIGKAAKPLGDDILRALGNAAKGWREWTGSVKGQNALRNYFAQAKPGIFEMGRLVRDLTKTFFRLGAQPGVASMIRQIRVELLPVLEDVIATTTEAFGPSLIAALVSVARVMGDLAGANGPLVFLVDTIRLFADALHALFTEIPFVKTMAVELSGMMAVMGVASMAAKVLGIKKIAEAWRGVGTAAKGAAVAQAGAGAAGAAGGAAAGGAAAGAAKGAAAGGLGGFLARAKPIAKKAGLIGVGYSVISGLQDAFGDRAKQQSTGGKIQSFLSGATAGLVPKVKGDFEKVRRQVLAGQKPRDIGKLLFSGDISGQTKRAVVELTRLRGHVDRLFGKGVVIRAGARKADFDAIAANFRRLKQGSDISLKQITTTVSNNMRLIARSMDVHSKGGQEAASRNFRLGLRSLQSSMRSGNVSAREGMVGIRNLLRIHSGAGKDALGKNMVEARQFISRTMRDSKGITKEGMEAIRDIFAKELRLYGLSEESIKFRLQGKEQSGKSIGSKLVGKARGGLVQYGAPGDAGRDEIPTTIGGANVVVGSGEVAAVINRHQQGELNARLADVGGLSGFFQKNDRPHYMAAGGVASGVPRMTVTGGGPSPLRTSVQGTLDKTRDAANRKLERAEAAAGAVGGAAGPSAKGPAGIGTYGGLPMANWVVEALRHAAKKGVNPPPTSGYRSHAYNVAQGRNYFSEHEGTRYPHGAVDYGGFTSGLAAKMSVVGATQDFKYPLLAPKGFRDDGHASGTGHARGGIIRGLASGGILRGLDRRFPATTLGSPGVQLSDLQVRAAAEKWGGLNPARALQAAQISRGESNHHPGITGFDPGGTRGIGLWQITRGVQGALGKGWIDKRGGDAGMRNPKMNAQVMSIMSGKGSNWGNWFGTKFLQPVKKDVASVLAAGGRGGAGGEPGVFVRPGGKGLFGNRRSTFRRPKGYQRRKGKGRPGGPGTPGPGAPDGLFASLEKFVEDQSSLFSDDQRSFQLDDILSEDELNKLLGRAGGIRGAIAKQLGLLQERIVPDTRENLEAVRKLIAQQVARVKAQVARVKAIRAELATIRKKKKPTKKDRERAAKLGAEGAAAHRELKRLTGDENPAPNQLVTGGELGKNRERVDGLKTKLADSIEKLRPSQLPASLRDWDFNIEELKKNGATKPEGTPDAPDSGATAELMREQLSATRRSLAVSQAQFDVFKGLAPLVGRYAHGGRVLKTGLAEVHRDEYVVTDPKGPYGSQFSGGGAPVNVTVLFKGQAPSYSDVEVLVDGKLQDYNRETARRTRQIVAAPGR